MTRNDDGRTERRDFVDAVQPSLHAGTCTVETKEAAIHEDVSGEQNIVAFNENQNVAICVRSAVPQKPCAYPAEIESLFRIENFVRATERRVLHQFRHRRRSRGEIRLHAELVDILLLRASTDDLCARWKDRFAKNVFRVKVGRDDIELGVLADFSHFSKHRLTISRSQSRIDDER